MIDMECSWFPELWIHDCCVAHDLGGSDIEFLQCLVHESTFLGPLGVTFAVIVFTGMVLGRPIRNLFLRILGKR
jgi:hypothetical protein